MGPGTEYSRLNTKPRTQAFSLLFSLGFEFGSTPSCACQERPDKIIHEFIQGTTSRCLVDGILCTSLKVVPLAFRCSYHCKIMCFVCLLKLWILNQGRHFFPVHTAVLELGPVAFRKRTNLNSVSSFAEAFL